MARLEETGNLLDEISAHLWLDPQCLEDTARVDVEGGVMLGPYNDPECTRDVIIDILLAGPHGHHQFVIRCLFDQGDHFRPARDVEEPLPMQAQRPDDRGDLAFHRRRRFVGYPQPNGTVRMPPRRKVRLEILLVAEAR